MEGASPATFRPTWQQGVGHGLYLGVFGAAVSVTTGVLAALLWSRPPAWMWAALIAAPLLVGAVAGLLAGRRTGIEVGDGGIRTSSVFEEGVAPWSHVVDLRAERRGRRTVVSVYLDSGATVRLHAPYSGGLFAADPQFELKVCALSHLWRSHRFGGLPG
ncbi:hypothetical protein [Actinoplanes xinjiangensis]|jgi:hypothetical protein|uniref:PH (Pleckstrin Homology) domain-containing protein n=1 Tax=Actinoplanes xinjiangensis TaxID=512350 RepID=A0A316FNK4_9ACTN|nr:hypothetical protein [Actinoplanes xinjiangensis]PWK50129.1 hypothetical protein BC793_1039 [Actinoplanes xinjiangensis]GIF36017.1 hypothetical protein Axi01nite_03280 [Actinoplanes xinjiangensis]